MLEQEEPSMIVCGKKEELLTYEQARKFVGGDIQTLYLKTGSVLLVNENGIDLQLKINIPATEIYRKSLAMNEDVLPKAVYAKRYYKIQSYEMSNIWIVGNAIWVSKPFAKKCLRKNIIINGQ